MAQADEKQPEAAVYPQTTDKVFMIPPNKYAGWNEEAAKDNKFMEKRDNDLKVYKAEHSALVDGLQKAGVEVVMAEITDDLNTPDAIFPNNWLSIHDGTACKYPMKVPNRRDEIRQYMVEMLKQKKMVKDEYDMTAYVEEGKFFEGTGALVLDRANRIAYCNLSQRANAQLAVQWANRFGYKLVLFEAFTKDADGNENAIYHTNVMMSIGTKFAIVCLDSIKGDVTRQYVKDMLVNESKRELIEISPEQMMGFCGNALEVKAKDGSAVLAMSDKSYKAFGPELIKRMEQHVQHIVHPDIDNIEKIFGGGVRCMIAEIFV